LVAVLLLFVLWGMATRSAWPRRGDLVVMSCAAAVIVQVLLASVYGDEPFLYSAPLVPMVAALVVASAGPSTRRQIAALCWLLVPVLVVLNLQHLHDAAGLIARSR
jgi:membrane-associated HD superfamily phosphohydrolase